MTEHSIWVFIHILLFVYWLGGDLGVLILARAATQAKLSFAERVFSLKMSLLIDVLPRICQARAPQSRIPKHRTVRHR